MNVKFTPIQEHHVETILTIENAIFSYTYWTKQQFIDCISNTEQYYSICLQLDNQIIGYAILLLIPAVQEAELLTIGIHQTYQGQAYSQLLLNHLITYCEQLKINTLFLEVRESNLKAQKFYLKHHFEIIGKRKKYYVISDNQFEDAILMSLSISE